jgi:hypothetical protein
MLTITAVDKLVAELTLSKMSRVDAIQVADAIVELIKEIVETKLPVLPTRTKK